MASYFCHKCNTPWESDKRQPGFKETCTGCDAYLHCCKNCRYHVPSAHNQCYIPNTEYVANRAGLNFCEEFEFGEGAAKPTANVQKQEAARNKLDALFGEEDEKPVSFDDLFKE